MLLPFAKHAGLPLCLQPGLVMSRAIAAQARSRHAAIAAIVAAAAAAAVKRVGMAVRTQLGNRLI